MNAVESAWLRWAWNIVAETPATHLAQCRAAGGSEDETSHLSPGFIGPGYRRGGLLAASLAHGPGPKSPAALRLRATAAQWIAARRRGKADADEAFMGAWRT